MAARLLQQTHHGCAANELANKEKIRVSSPPLHLFRNTLTCALFLVQMIPSHVLCLLPTSTLTLGRSAAFVAPLHSSTRQRLRATRRANVRLMVSDPLYSDLAPMGVSEQLQNSIPVEQLSTTTNILVFIIGIIPFVWATYEFWRRIAVGASFGTGSDSVIIPSPFSNDDDVVMIGEDNNPSSSRGRRTLDRGALTVAYVLFAVAAGSVAIAVASVVMSPQAPM
jgi:hypothetical protein